MNGNSGIQPTIELATNGNNGGFYPYPIYPMMSGGNSGGGFGGWGGDSAIWLIVLLALIWGNNGNGNGGGFFGGGNSFDNGYAWLSNGQKDIMNNTNQGFDTLHLSNQLEGTRDGIYSLSNQLCNCCSDMQQTVSNGFFNAEIAENNRQMANMNQLFALSTQLCNASADNRLGIANLTSTILAENCADRAALADSTQRIISNATDNTRAVLDKLCQLELDGKQDRINELERQNLMLNLDRSQTAQNAFISQGFANEVDQLYNRLNNCPVPTTPVYGRTPIFTCPNNNGCGCNNNFATSQLF